MNATAQKKLIVKLNGEKLSSEPKILSGTGIMNVKYSDYVDHVLSWKQLVMQMMKIKM